MDLKPLTIDRSGEAARSRRGSAWRWLVPLVLLLFLAWFFRSPLTRFLDRVRLPRVSVVQVQRTSSLAATAVSGTAANGYIVASKRAALSADTPGRIVELNVTEGSVVKKGDVVARLYAEEYRAALRRAEADLAAAHTAVERSAAQVDVAGAELERAASAVASLEAGLVEAEAGLKLAKLDVERAEKLVTDRIESQERLDQAQAEHDRAEARRDRARADLATAKDDVRTAGLRTKVAETQRDEARAQITIRVAARDEAAATLDKTEVRAPFDGIVVLKDAEVGEVVSPNAQGNQSRGSVCTMVDFASLEVQVDMPETSLRAVELGAPAVVFLDAYPEEPYEGRVERIWPTANRQKATVEVRVRFVSPDEKLRPDMGARVVFSAEAFEAPPEQDVEARVLVPLDCVVRIEGRPGVFVLERDVARFHGLELGEERSGRVLVLAGLDGGERIVSNPPPSLADGDRVRWEGDA